MERYRRTRRRVLASGFAVGIGGLAGCSGSTDDTTEDDEGTESSVEPVVSIPGEPVPENMAFDSEGNLLFGITDGELRRLPQEQLGESDLTLDDTEQVASLPEVIGVETGPDDTVYVTVPTDDEQGGVWEVPPDSDPSQLVSIGGFPNDIVVDSSRDRLLVTESFGGVVYAVDITDGAQAIDGERRSTWLDDDRLDTDGFGANGITRDGNAIYIAVTQAPNDSGRLLRASIADDGSASETTLFAEGSELAGADGIDAADGAVYVAANSLNRVVRVADSGEPLTVATGDDGLVFPSDVEFGPDGEWLYICNFANQSPEEAAILRTQV